MRCSCFYPLFTGEAAGLALGLVMLGSKSAQAIEDMVGYAQETQHEKILRGLAVGIAMVMYGRMEEADTLIESLCRDKVTMGLGNAFACTRTDPIYFVWSLGCLTDISLVKQSQLF